MSTVMSIGEGTFLETTKKKNIQAQCLMIIMFLNDVFDLNLRKKAKKVYYCTCFRIYF